MSEQAEEQQINSAEPTEAPAQPGPEPERFHYQVRLLMNLDARSPQQARDMFVTHFLKAGADNLVFRITSRDDDEEVFDETRVLYVQGDEAYSEAEFVVQFGGELDEDEDEDDDDGTTTA